MSTRREHSFIGIYSPADKSLRYIDGSVDRDSDPVWSPDSSKVAYTRVPAQSRIYAFVPRRSGEPWSIRAFNLSANSAEEIFRADAGPGSLWHPVVADSQLLWTADNQIVFPWEKTGWCHLYSIPASGHGAPKELTPGEGEVEHVAPSADGKAVYYSTNIKDIDRRHLWVVRPVRSECAQAADVRGRHRVESRSYRGRIYACVSRIELQRTVSCRRQDR